MDRRGGVSGWGGSEGYGRERTSREKDVEMDVDATAGTGKL